MEEHELETVVSNFLVAEKSYPASEIQRDIALGASSDSNAQRADIAILDSRSNEILTLYLWLRC